jgi:glycosyltransferase involved in cell wall biosynthesis
MNRKALRWFSVVMPLFNKEPFVERAIRSVLGQTHANFELVVIDDGSTDEGPAKVRAISDTRVRLLQQRNSGVAAARNAGVLEGRYEHLAFLDADDTWEPECLAKLNELMDAFPEAGLVGVNQWIILANGKVVWDAFKWLFAGAEKGLLSQYFSVFAKIGRSPFSNSGFALRRAVFNEVGGYRCGVTLTEDSDLWCRVALTHDVAFATTPLVTYYMGTPGNTLGRFEPRDFEVSVTLQTALDNNRVRATDRRGAQRLVSLQQLRLVRRALVATNMPFVRKKVVEWRFLRRYPFQSLLYLAVSRLPPRAVRMLFRWVKRGR